MADSDAWGRVSAGRVSSGLDSGSVRALPSWRTDTARGFFATGFFFGTSDAGFSVFAGRSAPVVSAAPDDGADSPVVDVVSRLPDVSAGAADAIPVPHSTAVPIPSAAASPPTLPMWEAVLTRVMAGLSSQLAGSLLGT